MAKYVYFDDGVVGLSIERHSATIRLLEKPHEVGSRSKPAYVGTMHASAWTADIVALSGAFGKCNRRYQALIVTTLHEAGFKHLFVERTEGSVAMGKLSEHPAFEGWFEIDLVAAAKQARRIYPRPK